MKKGLRLELESIAADPAMANVGMIDLMKKGLRLRDSFQVDDLRKYQ